MGSMGSLGCSLVLDMTPCPLARKFLGDFLANGPISFNDIKISTIGIIGGIIMTLVTVPWFSILLQFVVEHVPNRREGDRLCEMKVGLI